MKVEELQRCKCASDWEMGWFCDECDRLVDARKKAYLFEKKKLCRDCAEKKVRINDYHKKSSQ